MTAADEKGRFVAWESQNVVIGGLMLPISSGCWTSVAVSLDGAAHQKRRIRFASRAGYSKEKAHAPRCVGFGETVRLRVYLPNRFRASFMRFLTLA